MIDVLSTWNALTEAADSSLRPWMGQREYAIAAAINDVDEAVQFAKEFDDAHYRLPGSRPEMMRLSEQISAFPIDKVKRWRAFLPRGSAYPRPWPFQLLARLKVEIEREEGAARWVRKDEVEREDGTAKNITVGTRVIARPSRSSRTAKAGGVVIGTASDEISKRKARDAVGTVAAVRVRFDPVGR